VSFTLLSTVVHQLLDTCVRAGWLQDKFNAITVLVLLWITLVVAAVGSYAFWGIVFDAIDERVMHSIQLAKQGHGQGLCDKKDCRNPCRCLCKVCACVHVWMGIPAGLC
jgi:hypothetical protein